MSKIIEPIGVKDPILQADERLPFPILKGGSDITYKTQRVSGGVSNSGFNFTFNTPSQRIAMSREIILEMKVRVKLSRDDGSDGDLVFQSGLEGPRQYAPLAITDTINATINNQSITDKISDNFHALAKYMAQHEFENGKNSMMPTMQDYYQEYADGTDSNKNPLSQYSESAYEIPRGAFPAQIITNTTTDFEAVYTVSCYLPISPFQFNKLDSHNGLFWISNMSVDLNLVNNLYQRFWSRASTAKALDFNQVSIDDASLKLKYVTPTDAQIPQQVTYDYFAKNVFTTALGDFTSGQERRVTSQNIQLSSVPHRIYVYARERNSDRDSSVESTDTFHSLSDISIQFDNQSGMLSSASQQDLYQISVKNGLQNVSYNDWVGSTQENVGSDSSSVGLQGSVLCLEPGSDLRLRDGVSVGMTGNWDFQIEATVKNNRSSTVNTDLYVVVVYRGAIVSRKDGVLTANTGLLTYNDVKSLVPRSKFRVKRFNTLYGGMLSMSDKIDKVVSKVVDKSSSGGAKMSKKQLSDRLLNM